MLANSKSLAPEPYLSSAMMLLKEVLLLVRALTSRPDRMEEEYVREIHDLMEVMQNVPMSLVAYGMPHDESTTRQAFGAFDASPARMHGAWLVATLDRVTAELDARAKSVVVTEAAVQIDLVDGRTLVIPLTRYPRLAQATTDQRRRWQLTKGERAIAWDVLNEHIDLEAELGGPTTLAPEPYLTTRLGELHNAMVRIGEITSSADRVTSEQIHTINRLVNALHNVPDSLRGSRTWRYVGKTSEGSGLSSVHRTETAGPWVAVRSLARSLREVRICNEDAAKYEDRPAVGEAPSAEPMTAIPFAPGPTTARPMRFWHRLMAAVRDLLCAMLR